MKNDPKTNRVKNQTYRKLKSEKSRVIYHVLRKVKYILLNMWQPLCCSCNFKTGLKTRHLSTRGIGNRTKITDNVLKMVSKM